MQKEEQARVAMTKKQEEQKRMISTLQREQKTIQQVIQQEHKQADELNRKIDALIAIEVEKARKAAEAEAAKKKAEREAAAKKKAEELARKKAEAERAKKENERRIAEAKEREAKAKAHAKEVAKSNDAAARERAEQEAREAEAARKAAERKADAEASRSKREIDQAKRESDDSRAWVTAANKQLNGSFQANRHRLPMPITGPYQITCRHGANRYSNLPGIQLPNVGIRILGKPGAQARSIFNGTVSGISPQAGGVNIVLVTHGSYISVYSNLKSVAVKVGQQLTARQIIGTPANNLLEFRLYNGKVPVNPEEWLAR